MMRQIEKRKKSSLPILIMGAVWVVCAILLPIYRLWAVILAAVLGIAAYIIAAKLIPDRVEVINVPSSFATGDDDLNKALSEAEGLTAELNRLNDEIPDKALSAAIDRMSAASDSIIGELSAHPDKAKTARRFLNYYLPSSVQLLRSYADTLKVEEAGENQASIRRDIEAKADTVAAAFEHQLDRLYATEALNVSAQAEVLEEVLKSEGLVEPNKKQPY